jgi:hypothetical protein
MNVATFMSMLKVESSTLTTYGSFRTSLGDHVFVLTSLESDRFFDGV